MDCQFQNYISPGMTASGCSQWRRWHLNDSNRRELGTVSRSLTSVVARLTPPTAWFTTSTNPKSASWVAHQQTPKFIFIYGLRQLNNKKENSQAA